MQKHAQKKKSTGYFLGMKKSSTNLLQNMEKQAAKSGAYEYNPPRKTTENQHMMKLVLFMKNFVNEVQSYSLYCSRLH